MKGINVAQTIGSSDSNVRSKTGKKYKKLYFCLFYTLCWIAWQPYRLSHVDALHINLSYWPKNQSLKLPRKNSTFFCFIPWKLVKVSCVARMGRNFDDYSGFQLKTTQPKHSWGECFYWSLSCDWSLMSGIQTRGLEQHVIISIL